MELTSAFRTRIQALEENLDSLDHAVLSAMSDADKVTAMTRMRRLASRMVAGAAVVTNPADAAKTTDHATWVRTTAWSPGRSAGPRKPESPERLTTRLPQSPANPPADRMKIVSPGKNSARRSDTRSIPEQSVQTPWIRSSRLCCMTRRLCLMTRHRSTAATGSEI